MAQDSFKQATVHADIAEGIPSLQINSVNMSKVET